MDKKPEHHLKPHQFTKGKSGNLSGRPKLPEDVREFKKYSYDSFVRKLQEFTLLTKEELTKRVKDPGITMFDLMFAKVVIQAAEGDKDARNLIIDRLWGKVKEQIDVQVIKPFVVERLDGTEIVLGANIIQDEPLLLK